MRHAAIGILFGLSVLAGCDRQHDKAAPSESPVSDVLPVHLYKPGLASAFVVLGDNSIEAEPPMGPDEAGLVIRSNATALNPQGDGNAVILRIPDTVRNATPGRSIRVVVRARAATQNGSPVMRVFHSRPGVASSGWQEFRPTATFQDFGFDYKLPVDIGSAYSTDLVGIWADPEGKGRGIEVSAVRLEPLNPIAP